MCYVNKYLPTINPAFRTMLFIMLTSRLPLTYNPNRLTRQHLARSRSLSPRSTWRHSYKHYLVVKVLLFPLLYISPYNPLTGRGPPKSAGVQPSRESRAAMTAKRQQAGALQSLPISPPFVPHSRALAGSPCSPTCARRNSKPPRSLAPLFVALFAIDRFKNSK